ncbi:MAG: HAMP domain-containing histidine kinase [Gemmatimonadaceae bacterium]|nr:HAMP domain-containing histidine kinase [Gemmatimonadaceae bacterium]
MSSALPLVSGRAAWESVAASGQRAIAAVRGTGLDRSQRELVDAHERELRTSLEQARRYSFLAERSVRIVGILAVLALLVFGIAASRVAGHLSRQMSRPLDEIIRWTDLIGRGESLPAPAEQQVRGAPEFATLRQRMRDMAAAVETGRRREAETQRLSAYRESARRVAHELKNPLTPIRFAITRLRRDAPAELRETIDVLDAESRRIERIAHSFAQFGRMPEGTASDVDIAELVRYLVSATVPPEMEVEVLADDDLPLIRGFHDALAGALSNVILNAIDACADGGRITVTAAQALLGDHHAVRIEVADTGCGIPQGEVARIWDPYVTQKAGGTGLGLAIARQTVLAHDGTVAAESTLGGGTRIRITLPAGPAQRE